MQHSLTPDGLRCQRPASSLGGVGMATFDRGGVRRVHPGLVAGDVAARIG